jgi:hypothetical protein
MVAARATDIVGSCTIDVIPIIERVQIGAYEFTGLWADRKQTRVVGAERQTRPAAARPGLRYRFTKSPTPVRPTLGLSSARANSFRCPTRAWNNPLRPT